MQQQSQASAAQSFAGARTAQSCANISRCASHIAPGQFQAGEEHFADNESVNHAVILPRQLQALLRVLLSGIQVVPFVANTGQTKIRFSGIRQRLITHQLQHTLISFGRPIELVLQFL